MPRINNKGCELMGKRIYEDGRERSVFAAPNPRHKELEELLRDYSTVVTYPAKKVFLEPGDVLNGIYYIAEGRTWHYIIDKDGTEKKIYMLSAGWFYGETPAFLQEPTGLYSRTDVKTTLYKISWSNFQLLYDTNKIFRDAIFLCVTRKLLIMRHEIENLTFNSCKDRLVKLFCCTANTEKVIEGEWYALKAHYTQYELSTIVGGARVTISKLINELCNEGFIRLLNHKIQVNIKAYDKFVLSESKEHI